MAVAEDRFFETRAAQLAIVHLTRHPDVQVTQEPREYGVDLLVSLLENGQNVGRLLAVEVKAVPSQAALASADNDSLWRDASSYSFRLPFCLFVFSMDDDRGYWRWIREPAPESPEKRRLVSVTEGEMKALTKDALNKTLSSVRDWYDA